MNEKNVFSKGLKVVLISILMQLCLGTIYIWGVFQPALVKLFSCNQATIALTFSLVLGVFVVGSTIGGILQDKYSPRPVVFFGGLLISIGVYFTSYTTADKIWLLWISYGVFAGFGLGMLYTTTISCCQKWFPKKKGFITGLIVSALGFGGFIFTPIARYLINNKGVMETFTYFSFIFLVVCMLGAWIITNPKEVEKKENTATNNLKEDFTPMEMIKKPQFYILFFTLVLACASGLMVIPFAKILGISGGLSDIVATGGVMVIALLNSFGRLFCGIISDKIGTKKTIMILLLISCISILLLSFAKMYFIIVLLALVSFSYGGFLGVFPSLTADFFGTKYLASNYGFILLGFGVSALTAPYFAGRMKDLTNNFYVAFLVAAIASIVGLIIFSTLKHPHKNN